MLRIRPVLAVEDTSWFTASPDCVLAGLSEDTDYVLDVGEPRTEVFVDDVVLAKTGATTFHWRPAFYAGRVLAEVVRQNLVSESYFLDVSPNSSKSGQEVFDEMVEEIRSFDQTLLSGLSSATLQFGQTGRRGRYELDILLSRVREHGPPFLACVEAISKSPHRFLIAHTQTLPLSRIRRLHHSALRDGRLVALATGQGLSTESMDAFQVSGLTSAPTFDTPANRALLALLRRFRAALVSLEGAVQRYELGSPREEQLLRANRRLLDLHRLANRTRSLLFGPLFRDVPVAETSSAGLTQISAQPNYSKAYRLGARALSTQIDGDAASDQLHIPPSWGIYETWCFLTVAKCASSATGQAPVESSPRATSAGRSMRFQFSQNRWLEVLFQASFPSLKPAANRTGWSVSRERRPDLVLVDHGPHGQRAMIFDAKWRSGRDNVLQAMESAHIYHDALRVGTVRPCPCVLLLPGSPYVPELEQPAFLQAHGVGAVSFVRVSATGPTHVEELIKDWLRAGESSH